MYVPFKFVSEAVAERIAEAIIKNVDGCPTENRVLILSPKNQDVKIGSILLPGSAKEDIPNKGVIIMVGSIEEEYRSYRYLIKPGRVITYGMYAGKKIDFPKSIFEDEGINFGYDDQEFSVLSLNEVIFTEKNPM